MQKLKINTKGSVISSSIGYPIFGDTFLAPFLPLSELLPM